MEQLEENLITPPLVSSCKARREIYRWHWRLWKTSALCSTTRTGLPSLSTNWILVMNLKWRGKSIRNYSLRLCSSDIASTVTEALHRRQLIHREMRLWNTAMCTKFEGEPRKVEKMARSPGETRAWHRASRRYHSSRTRRIVPPANH